GLGFRLSHRDRWDNRHSAPVGVQFEKGSAMQAARFSGCFEKPSARRVKRRMKARVDRLCRSTWDVPVSRRLKLPGRACLLAPVTSEAKGPGNPGPFAEVTVWHPGA